MMVAGTGERRLPLYLSLEGFKSFIYNAEPQEEGNQAE